MAGIGIELTKIFRKDRSVTPMVGYAYNVLVTTGPVLMIVVEILFMLNLLGIDAMQGTDRIILNCTILYAMVGSNLVINLIAGGISKYTGEQIYLKKYGNVLTCFSAGLSLIVVTACVPGFLFFCLAITIGHTTPVFAALGYLLFLSVVLTSYTGIFLGACKESAAHSIYYIAGTIAGLFSSVIYNQFIPGSYAMICGLCSGFMVTAIAAYVKILRIFPRGHSGIRSFFSYLKANWKLPLGGVFYGLGLYIHNFIFWTSDLGTKNSIIYVCAEPYDVATFLGVLTTFTMDIIFMSMMETYFVKPYHSYLNTISGKSYGQLEREREKVIGTVRSSILNSVRIQALISVILILGVYGIVKDIRFSGSTALIYPSVATGWFFCYFMHELLSVLLYFENYRGYLISCVVFCVSTGCSSLLAVRLPLQFSGIGLIIGSLTGILVSWRITQAMFQDLNRYILVKDHIMKRGIGRKPSHEVYRRKGRRRESA